MRLQARIPLNWKGEELEAGAVITPVSPDDDALVDYWAKFGAFYLVPDEGEVPPLPGAPRPGEEGEGPAPQGGATQPMTSTAVGRRQRATSGTE